MGISLHIREVEQTFQKTSVRDHVAVVYGQIPGRSAEGTDVGPGTPDEVSEPIIDRWYIGDEFCASRLPSARCTAAFVRRAAEAGTALTLLTPPLTDAQIDGLVPVLECLAGASCPVQVTLNDWGLFLFLKERFPCLTPALGRLLNKGFKDPRLGEPEAVMAAPEADRTFLQHATFDQPRFREKVSALGVARFERDLMPYDRRTDFVDSPSPVSVYFPFGYVTTGRVCWPATFVPGREADFRPRRACGRPCEGRPLTLEHRTAGFHLHQSGNTIFYLYPAAVTAELLRQAGEEGLRLVYQGVAL